jgi:hypothetical protein
MTTHPLLWWNIPIATLGVEMCPSVIETRSVVRCQYAEWPKSAAAMSSSSGKEATRCHVIHRRREYSRNSVGLCVRLLGGDR